MKTYPLSRRSVLQALAATPLVATVPGFSQVTFPSKALRLLVPAPAGTSPDIIARLWSDRFTQATGQPVVIDNRPGASTIIATQAAAAAPADGYTLLWTFNATFSMNPFIFRKLPYKLEDFTPVTRILSVPYVLLVSAESKIQSLDDLVREAKARPGALNYASVGVGSGFHVVTARLMNEAGISMTHVSYKDSHIPDLMAQRIDVAFDASTTAIPMVKAGKLRALAVTSLKRIDALPQVPTLAEKFPGFVGDSWQGLFAPKGTPASAIDVISAHAQRIVGTPDFRAALLELALTPAGGTPEDFRRFLVEDTRTWAKVIRDNRIAVD